MRLSFLFFVFVLLHFNSVAQIEVLTDSDIFSKSSNQISIKVVNNNVLVPVDLGFGMQLYFLLDTGVKTTIITEPMIINILGLPLERKIKVRGYGSDEPIPAWVSTKLNYRLNDDYKFTNQDVIVLEEAVNLDQFLGEPVYGIIGYDFLSKHEVTIDFVREKLIIKEPKNAKRIDRLKRKKRVEVYDLEFLGSKPFITTEIRHSAVNDSLKLLVDTGFSGALSLYPNDKTNQFKQEPLLHNYQGYGMNGLILSKFKKIDGVSLSDQIEFESVSTHFIDTTSLRNVTHIRHSDGSIGNDILRRFRVSLDYKNMKMYLRPIQSRLDDPFMYNRAGIRVLYRHSVEEGSQFVVQSLRKGSEAERCGLQNKDILLAIDGRKVKNVSMRRVYELLNDFNTDERVITVMRKNTQHTFEFRINPIQEWN